jgi:asparagine N-glycosylation enzyme membrane subunit Stt3
MLEWTKNNLGATTVVCSWWDYGYWLTIMGNVTTLADNGTVNTTQIQNIGFVFMANETQALKMLELYDAKYILVFTTFYGVQTNVGSAGTWAGYGDEGKWMWMARISGQARDRFIEDGFLDANSSWTNETKFGGFTGNRWTWNDVGKNSTIYKLMSHAKNLWCIKNGVTDPDEANVQHPVYFKEAYIAGLDLSPNDSLKYNGLVPLVCLYEINWQKYYTDYPKR